MTPVQKIVDAIRSRNFQVREEYGEWRAQCPAHGDCDSGFNLQVTEAEDRGAVIKCWSAKCTTEAILRSIGLTKRDLFPDDFASTNGQPLTNGKPQSERPGFPSAEAAVEWLEAKHERANSGLWFYYHADGDEAGAAVRFESDDGKEVIPLRCNPDGWRIGGMSTPRPLYRLPELAAADCVFVVEGEKCCDALRSIGLTATTSTGGSKAAGKSDWSPLHSKSIVILPDHDDAGEQYTRDVLDNLIKCNGESRVDRRPTVKIIRLAEHAPELPEGGDIADVLSDSAWCGLPLGDAAIPEDLAALLLAMAERTEPVEFASDDDTAGEADVTSTYRPFPTEVLPGIVGEYVVAASSAIGCDPSFIAMPLLGCLARAIGNSRVIRLKLTWTEPPIIWGAIIGKSGTHKTPAIQAAMSFLQQRQSDLIARYREEISQHAEDLAIHEVDLAEWKRSARKEGSSIEPPPSKPEDPVCERLLTSDCTIEALASLLANQPDGILVVRDELSGWLGGIAEYKGGKGSDLGHWLACWSGVPLTVDRKTGQQKLIHVDRAAVSIIGGIQPGVLRAAIGREHLVDGLCARLLMAMPDPRPVRWTEETVDGMTEILMGGLFDKLLGLEPESDDDGNPVPITMDMSAEAKAVWVAYFNRHRAELADLHDDLAAAWSKLEAYTARFALIFQLCCDRSDTEIDTESMEAAIALSDWFGGEAKRVYGLFSETDEDRAVRDLMQWISRKGGTVTPRELMRSNSRKYPTSEAAELALNALAKLGHGRWEVLPAGSRGGRPSRVFNIV